MNLGEIEAIAAGGESELVEFKRTTGQRSDGAKAICAMLNGTGGFVLFGVEDDGTVRGMQVTARTVEDLDTPELVRTVEEAIRRLRLEDPGTRDPETLLRGLRLLRDGQPVNAAVVLFGRADWLFPA